MNKTKILYLSPLPPPVGGISAWTERLRKYGLPDPYKFKIVNTNILSNRKIHGKFKYDFSEVKRTVNITINLIKQILFFHPDIIHINCSLSPQGIFRDLFCAYIGKVFKKKIISQYRGNVPDFPKTTYYGLSYYFLTKLIRSSDINIALNKPSLQVVRKYTNQINSENGYLLPGFLDDHYFTDLHSSIESTESEKIRAIYIGGFSWAKGAHDILEIAKRFPEIEFTLIGTILESFIPLLKSKPQNVIIKPQMAHEMVLKELRRNDFFIFLSHSEGFPNAVLEAMACRLAVIATHVGAVPEMIDEGKGGFLVPPMDYDKMEIALKKLADSSNIADFGLYNFNKAKQQYSYSTVIKQLCDIYTSV